tara:strand:- start:486 stop:839 length:354 start_codon:yes stop_codon:yes gene_type:complete
MNIHEMLMIKFTFISTEMMKEEKNKDDHPARILFAALCCLMSNEIEGEQIDETIEIFNQETDQNKRNEMFETVLHILCMGITHLDSFIEKFCEEKDSKQDVAGKLKKLLDDTGLSLN